MKIRYAIIAAAIGLSLAGCIHQGKQRYARRAADHNRMVARQPLPPEQLYFRGPMDREVQRKATYHQPPAGHAPAPAVTTAPYRLDSGDRLRVVVFGQENLSRTYSVDGGGFISMPLIGAVRARGSTTFELERRVAARLRSKYVKDPKVTVEVQNYRPFFILGEVRRPGQFPYVSGMTVQTAVAIAGGYTERAREQKVKITRRKNGQDTTFKVPGSYHVLPGDTIYVTERIF